MANMLFANNANTTLASSLSAGATSMSVTSASAFPSPTGSQYFYCTLADAATQTTIEIVKVTAVSGTTFTIVRGQDGTSGTAFASGAVVSLRLVRASLNDFAKLDEANTFTQLQTINTIAVSGSTSTTPVLSFNAANCPIASGTAISGSYLQFVLQNTSGTANASTNYVLSNDLGTDSSYYGEFGMNSSVYSGSSTPVDFFSINNGVYFSAHDGDVTVGAGNGKKLYLAWGTSGQSAHVINASGAIGLNTNLASGTGSGTTNFGTAGQPLLSGGSSATPTWGTLGVAAGGTGLTTLTAGYIPYGNGASAFGSSSNLFWDSTNNRLGIGTSSPGYTLHVAGDAFAANFKVGLGNSLFATNDGYNGLYTYGSSGSGYTNSVGLWTNAVQRVLIDSSGNTGIGTNSPGTYGKLAVNGAIAQIAAAGSYTIDVTNNSSTVAIAGTVNFPNMSGMIIVNSSTSASIAIWLVSGGVTSAVSNVNGATGTITYNATIGGYTWTNTTGSANTVAFFCVRTRTTA